MKPVKSRIYTAWPRPGLLIELNKVQKQTLISTGSNWNINIVDKELNDLETVIRGTLHEIS